MSSTVPEIVDGVKRLRLDVPRDTGNVPALLLLPEGHHGAGLPLLLVGHGGGPGKEAPWIVNVCRKYVTGFPCAAIVIDAPAHGERAPQGADPISNLRVVRRSLRDPKVIDQIIEDWRASIDAASEIASFDRDKLGYAGFSQGTLYGLSVVAALGNVKGAVFGIGGLPRPSGVANLIRQLGLPEETAQLVEDEDDPVFRAETALEAAAKLTDTEVLILQMTQDEVFPLEGALELFAAYPGPKRLAIWEGRHIELPMEAIDLSIGFLRRTVGGASPDIATSGAW